MKENRSAKPWDIFNKKIGRVSNVIYSERLKICRSCPEYIRPTHQCKKCGCIMTAKAKLPNAECPLQKWLREDS